MLAADGLGKRYPGGVEALHDVSFTVRDGEFCTLVGHNGAGKTTTMNCFLDFVRPDRGQAIVDGIVVRHRPIDARRHVAFLGENVAVYGSLTGRENVRFFVRLTGRRDFGDRDAASALDAAGLPTAAIDRAAQTYSKGMRQKVGLAIAYASGVRNLILDEPTSGLDPQSVDELIALLQSRRDDGCAILVSSHDLARCAPAADVIVQLEGGRLIDVARRNVGESAPLSLGAREREVVA